MSQDRSLDDSSQAENGESPSMRNAASRQKTENGESRSIRKLKQEVSLWGFLQLRKLLCSIVRYVGARPNVTESSHSPGRCEEQKKIRGKVTVQHLLCLGRLLASAPC